MRPLEDATSGDGWPDALDARTLQAVLVDTGVGHVWQRQAVAAGLLVLSSALPVRGWP